MCMANIAVHLAVAIWNTSIAEKNHELVHRLRVLSCVVPEICGIIGVRQVSRWVALLCMDLSDCQQRLQDRRRRFIYLQSEETSLDPSRRKQEYCWLRRPSYPRPS
jgi:hypothetical protein